MFIPLQTFTNIHMFIPLQTFTNIHMFIPLQTFTNIHMFIPLQLCGSQQFDKPHNNCTLMDTFQNVHNTTCVDSRC